LERIMTEVAAGDEQVSARERTGWVFRNARILILALILLLIAALLVGVSFAVFSTSSANAGNMFTAGTLTSSNSKDNAAILTAQRMVPGDTTKGTVTISNTGDSRGQFTLTGSTPTNTPGPNGGDLSSVLDLRIVEDPAGAARQVYNGKLNAMTGAQDLGVWNGGQTHTYEFTVTFPDSGTPSAGNTGDNAYQGSSTTVTYTWNATSVSSATTSSTTTTTA
jgi:Camelysin metallo-endopeptidase